MKLMESFRRSLPSAAAAVAARNDDAPMAFPPGHFYSPIPRVSSVLSRESEVFDVNEAVAGVDLNVEGQRETVKALAPFCNDQPFSDGATRFFAPNENFSIGEAVLYYGFLRWLRPNRVVEVGSGFTTAVLLDTLDFDGRLNTKVTCVEPYPERLRSLMRAGDEKRLRVVESELQEVGFDVFEELKGNDLLFIDSTHVAKTGSDVNRLLFDILPRLAPGVFIHIHDIYYPFEYPREWLLQGRAWNEAYAIRAFLQYNSAFEIVCFNSFLARFHRDLFYEMPCFLNIPGSGLWLRKR